MGLSSSEKIIIFSLKFVENNTELWESNCELEIDFFSSQEEREEAKILMNLEIESGLSWPFEEVFPDFSSFSKYFLSHSAFLVRVRNYKVKNLYLRNFNYPSRKNLCSSKEIFLMEWLDVSTSNQIFPGDVAMFVTEVL